jgi:hypothetical protein
VKISATVRPNNNDENTDADGAEEERTSHSFSVDQYVLPKFKVEVKPVPSFVTYNQSRFNVEVKSTYTHGKGVEGPCTIKVKPMYEPYIYDPVEREKEMNNPHSISRTKVETDLDM